jgi:shikimate O-hydroxycinnamoyltransferase
MVDVIEKTLVIPSEETPRGKLFLSNLEQVAPSLYTCLLYFYRNNEATGFFSIEVMKAALAKTLVLFYPLAGRFVVGDDGRKAIDCNAEGALLVVARSERSSDEINFMPSPELRSQFVPKATSLSLMIMLQV